MSRPASVNPSQHLKFSNHNDFRKALRTRAAEYFASKGLEERDQKAMFLKTALILSWFFGSYAVLVLLPVPFFVRVLAAISMGLAGAGVGFSVMHDAGHGAYSRRGWLNRAVFFSLDILGGSSFLWNVKHNILHHSYANIEGHDDDINMGVLGRLAPEQKLRYLHRYQHFYVWFLYGMMTLKWHFFDDFRTLRRGRIGTKALPKMKTSDKVTFVAGKLIFFTYAVVIPTAIFGFGWVALFYLLASFVQGVTMATIFQLAHCVEEADFPVAPETQRMEHDWATHQVLTTVDFAPKNRLLSWYVGGLNFQIEHHLFPKISHIHYPALARIVRETCEEFSIPYKVQPTFFEGLRSHYRWLRRMGRPAAA